MGDGSRKRQGLIIRVLVHATVILLALLLSSNNIHLVGSAETGYWQNLASMAWRYYQPGKGVEETTGLHHAGLYWPYFTDWDLSNYIMAILDAEELGLVSQNGDWGSDYRLNKLINFLKTRPLTPEGVPYLWYDSRTGTNEGRARANPSDSGKLLLVLDRLRKVKPQYSADIDWIVNVRTNYRALAADEGVWSSTSGPYAYLAALGFASFGMDVYAPVSRALGALEALENAPKVSVEGIDLPQAYLTLEPLLHLIFEADYDRRVSNLLFKLYLVHELRFQREGLRLAFSEGNTGLDNPSYVYEWVVTGDGGRWIITDHSGARRDDITPISFFKVAVAFRAIYDSEYARNLIDWIYSSFSNFNEPNCRSFDCGFMEGVDTSGRVVSVIIDRTNSLVLSAARYATTERPRFPVDNPLEGSYWYHYPGSGKEYRYIPGPRRLGHFPSGGFRGADDTYALDLNWGPRPDSDLGKPVYAIERGVIKQLDRMWGWVLIEHNTHLYWRGRIYDTWYSGYLHMQNIPDTLREGVSVEKSTIIGEVGRIKAKTPHLHFAIYVGRVVEPSEPGFRRDRQNAFLESVDPGQVGGPKYAGYVYGDLEAMYEWGWGSIYNHNVDEIVAQDSKHWFEKGGSDSDWFESTSYGFYSHMFYTHSTSASMDNWGRWNHEIQADGTYKIYVFIPRQHGDTTKARYQVFSNGILIKQAVVKQRVKYDEWVWLGDFNFRAGDIIQVYLSDNTGESNRLVAYDAVKIWAKQDLRLPRN
jgi:hypothetical protein